MELQNATFQTYHSFMEKLENLVYDVHDELHLKRQLREEWYNWHTLWKQAWLVDAGESVENLMEMRRKTSIRNRKQFIRNI